MLTKQDLREIRGVVGEEIDKNNDKLLEQVLLPQFDRIHRELTDVKSNVGTLKSDVGSLKSDVASIKATMVTKDFLEDRLADFKASLKTGAHTVNAKLNRLARLMHKKNILTVREVQEVTI